MSKKYNQVTFKFNDTQKIAAAVEECFLTHNGNPSRTQVFNAMLAGGWRGKRLTIADVVGAIPGSFTTADVAEIGGFNRSSVAAWAKKNHIAVKKVRTPIQKMSKVQTFTLTNATKGVPYLVQGMLGATPVTFNEGAKITRLSENTLRKYARNYGRVGIARHMVNSSAKINQYR